MSAPGDDRIIVEGERFAIVPEWVIDADIGDAAFRLYAVLLRYGQSSGRRMPSRSTLARRLRKRSVDTVDRAMKELVALGAVTVERRRDGRRNLTNLYHVRTSAPGRLDAATRIGSRIRPATGGRADAVRGGRVDAPTVAAAVRPDPQSLTLSTPPPTWAEAAQACQGLRHSLGLPVTRWSEHAVGLAVQRALDRGWPAEAVPAALRAVAADTDSRSPMRLAEAGPWWDAPASVPPAVDTSALEDELDRLDGARVTVQRLARAELTREGLPLTRALVVERAVRIARGRAL